MQRAHLIPVWQSSTRTDHVLVVALLISLILHTGGVYAAHRWGSCVCNVGAVVCPKLCPDPQPRINLKLSKATEPPPPPPPIKPRPPSKPAVIVEKPQADRPPAAPAVGQVVLPDEVVDQYPQAPAEITVERPTIPEEAVVRSSQVAAPVIATAEIFGRADEITPGAPGVFGLGGTGTATGIGPFGTEPEGGGQTTSGSLPAPVEQPKPEPPKPRGPSRPPRVLNWTDPPYPEQARQQGIEGTVVLRLAVSAAGRPQGVRVARSSGHSALDDAAVAHVRRARFSPALKDGETVPMTISFKVNFRLVNA